MSRNLGICLALGLAACSPPRACAAAAPIGHRVIYQDGTYRRMPDACLRKDEQTAQDSGHMLWRHRPLDVASVDAADILPPKKWTPAAQMTPGRLGGHDTLTADDVTWILMAQHDGKALVRVTVSGLPVGEIRLVQPFGGWWYVASARRTDVPRSRLVVVHPDRSREFLPGPLVLIGRRAYVPIRDLARVQLGVEWESARKAAKIYVPHTDFHVAWFRPGQRSVAWVLPENRVRLS